VLAAGTYNITLTTSQGGSQNVTINAVSGTAVGCPTGANSGTVNSVAQSAGNGATLLFPACTYNWTSSIAIPSNQRWVGIPGQSIFDAGGIQLTDTSACGDDEMVCGFNAGTTGVTIANLTFRNYGWNTGNMPPTCDPQANTCPFRGFAIATNNGWTVQNSVMREMELAASTAQISAGGTISYINNLFYNMGYQGVGSGSGSIGGAATINMIGNEFGFMNIYTDASCDGSGNKFLIDDVIINHKYNYYHDVDGPGFWADSYNNQTYNLIGNTFERIGTDGIYLEQQHSQTADIGFNVFDHNGDGSRRTAYNSSCGGEGQAWQAFRLDGSANANFHDNNISVWNVTKPGGPFAFSDEIGNGSGNVGGNVLQNNTVNFNYGSNSDANGAWGWNTTTESTNGSSSNGNHYHLSGGNVNTDLHWYWFNQGDTPQTFSAYQSSGQDSSSTIDTTMAPANGCLHVACAVNPVGPGGVQQTQVATKAIQNMILSNNTFTPNVANGAVGTVSVTMSDGSAFSGTLSIAGANSGGFHLSGNTLEEKASGGTPAGSYSDFNIVATQSGASNSPQRISPTVSGVAEAPFGGTVRSITNRIQAEDFDLGGYGVAYHAADACGMGIDTTYGPDRLNVYPTADPDGASNLKVGCNQAGDWHNYSITAPSNGFYTLSMRVANTTAGSTYHVAIDGVSAVQGIAVPNTGDYDAFATVTSAPFALTAGQHVMQIVLDTGSTGGFGGDFNWMQGTLVKSGTGSTKNIDITVTH
jgi:DUF5010 C-terminal domain